MTAILRQGGAILRATRRLKWPGEAAVVVSVVHVVKGEALSPVSTAEQSSVFPPILSKAIWILHLLGSQQMPDKAFVGLIYLGYGLHL